VRFSVGLASFALAAHLAGAVVAGSVAAQPATPAETAPVDPAECVVEPRPREEQRARLAAGHAARAASEATPAVAPAVSPVAFRIDAITGEPADAATVAAIAEAARAFYACVNAGDMPAMLALMTDETAAGYLADIALFRANQQGHTADPASLDPVFLERVLDGLADPNPRSPATRQTMLGIENARVQPSGCVRAAVLTGGTSDPDRDPFPAVADFCPIAGHLLWHVGPPPAGVDPLPTATPSA